MKNLQKSVPFRFALAAAMGLAASTLSSQAQSASATISGIDIGGGEFAYTITLDNTGSGNLDGFWYGWIQFSFDLPTTPSNPGNSLGWQNNVDGDSIQWVGNNGSSTFGTALGAGQTATFTFDSTSTPTEITTSPSGQSVAYVNTIDASQSSPGDSTGIFSPTLVPAPEPSSLGLMLGGLFVAGGSSKLMAARRKARA